SLGISTTAQVRKISSLPDPPPPPTCGRQVRRPRGAEGRLSACLSVMSLERCRVRGAEDGASPCHDWAAEESKRPLSEAETLASDLARLAAEKVEFLTLAERSSVFGDSANIDISKGKKCRNCYETGASPLNWAAELFRLFNAARTVLA